MEIKPVYSLFEGISAFTLHPLLLLQTFRGFNSYKKICTVMCFVYTAKELQLITFSKRFNMMMRSVAGKAEDSDARLASSVISRGWRSSSWALYRHILIGSVKQIADLNTHTHPQCVWPWCTDKTWILKQSHTTQTHVIGVGCSVKVSSLKIQIFTYCWKTWLPWDFTHCALVFYWALGMFVDGFCSVCVWVCLGSTFLHEVILSDRRLFGEQYQDIIPRK